MMMYRLMITTAVLATMAVSPAIARGGHGHGHGHGSGHGHGHHMHRHSQRALSAPANPSVPPSLTPDARLAGSAPLPAHQQSNKAGASSPEKLNPEDAKLDQKIKSICRGC
jgi:hypothetical protein